MIHNDPKEPREWGCTDDSPHNNGYWNDERRGSYYGRVSSNSDEIDEPEDEETDFDDSHYEGTGI